MVRFVCGWNEKLVAGAKWGFIQRLAAWLGRDWWSHSDKFLTARMRLSLDMLFHWTSSLHCYLDHYWKNSEALKHLFHKSWGIIDSPCMWHLSICLHSKKIFWWCSLYLNNLFQINIIVSCFWFKCDCFTFSLKISQTARIGNQRDFDSMTFKESLPDLAPL